jgi:hypothetical protein
VSVIGSVKRRAPVYIRVSFRFLALFVFWRRLSLAVTFVFPSFLRCALLGSVKRRVPVYTRVSFRCFCAFCVLATPFARCYIRVSIFSSLRTFGFG